MNIIVENSKIKGHGLFAQKHFLKGETVLGWNKENEFLTKVEAEALPEDLKHFIAVFKGQYLLIAEPERYGSEVHRFQSLSAELILDLAQSTEMFRHHSPARQ